MSKLFYLFLLFVGIGFNYCVGQSKVENGSLVPYIKTARAFVKGNELSYPIMQLNSDMQLLFEFDELSVNSQTYSYRILHCDANWQQTVYLELDDYIDGFGENTIDYYDYSKNTTLPYVHYELTIPNEDVQLTKSGNYLLQCYDMEFPDSTLVQFQFSIYESLLSIRGEIIRPIGVQYQNIGQELRLSVFHEDFEIIDPFSEISLEISQNNRPDKTLRGIKPLFVKDRQLVYGDAGQQIFLAGNEFRTFDIKNFKGIGLNVNDIKYVDSMYFVQLRLDERRSSKRYFWEKEMNGKNTVYVANDYDHSLSADYGKVFFELSMPEVFLDGSVYVFGNFNQWKLEEANKMVYNFETHSYECQMDLKQGYYDYYYAFLSNYDGLVDDQRIEGSHYQTENDYIVKVFHKPIGGNYDRLVGYRVFNSKYQ